MSAALNWQRLTEARSNTRLATAAGDFLGRDGAGVLRASITFDRDCWALNIIDSETGDWMGHDTYRRVDRAKLAGDKLFADGELPAVTAPAESSDARADAHRTELERESFRSWQEGRQFEAGKGGAK